ncbi:alpha/beta hydrolase [Bermanella marisrubri]|uniref:Alpha/beta hydrolase fold protein n=1 Tax=Bermanella marisrubri TaxID=207949 RepID=Q1N0M9_9GAMM|nr:alpha/beta hydrolase [Bermanella marisrubri]EAT11804.1 Alpha/beta hydrolase fold protein [Oceanobacter sp. RED65] [Bermanella marisrubri]QIZ83839.1 alpha/beta hydrolase [Bermanella marisrubri]
MERQALYFIHANGFPSESYRVLLNLLKQHYEVAYKPQFAHDERFPVSANWYHLVEEAIHDIANRFDEPVILVGHSMGGVICLLVSLQRPDLVKSVIMLDPPVIDFWSGLMLRGAKLLKLDDRITPAGRTIGRRDVFASKQEAIEYFRHKSLFKNVDPRCLEDYVEAGTISHGDGLRLTYEAKTEVSIYRTIPLNLYRHKYLTRPTFMVLGESSQVVRGLQKRHMRKLGVEIEFMAGGHLFPLERPEETAKRLHHIIQQSEGGSINTTKDEWHVN